MSDKNTGVNKRKPSDPALAMIAAKFAKLDPFPDEDNIFKDRMIDLPEWKNLHIYPNRSTFIAARFRFGGKYRIFAYSPFSRAADIARFADMVTLRFWKYKLRGACPPTDSDMNFSVKQAEDDLIDFEDAVSLIDEIEDHMVIIGVFTQLRNVSEEKTAGAAEKRRTARGEFLACHRSLITILETYFEDLNQKLDKQHGDLAGRLLAIERTVGLAKPVPSPLGPLGGGEDYTSAPLEITGTPCEGCGLTLPNCVCKPI